MSLLELKTNLTSYRFASIKSLEIKYKYPYLEQYIVCVQYSIWVSSITNCLPHLNKVSFLFLVFSLFSIFLSSYMLYFEMSNRSLIWVSLFAVALPNV